MPGCDLQATGILVTRPAHQASGLCRQIESRGGRPLQFPALEILLPQHVELARRRLMAAHGIVIFISPNAVEFGLSLLHGKRLPDGIRLAAVGKATAEALRIAGYRVGLLPSAGFDSEGLLSLPELQQVAGQTVVIVRGEGGRPLLGDTLRQRGARVVYAEVYRRRCPDVDATALLQRWDRDVALVTVTSNEVMRNLADLLGPAGWPRLRATPLLVISERMRGQAQKMGFSTILLARGASDEAITEAICHWVMQGESSGKQLRQSYE